MAASFPRAPRFRDDLQPLEPQQPPAMPVQRLRLNVREPGTVVLRASSSAAPAPNAPSYAQDMRKGLRSYTEGELEAQYIEHLKQQIRYLNMELDFLRSDAQSHATQARAELEQQLNQSHQQEQQRLNDTVTTLTETCNKLQAEQAAAEDRERRLQAELDNERYLRQQDKHALLKQVEKLAKDGEVQDIHLQQARDDSVRYQAELNRRNERVRELEANAALANEQFHRQEQRQTAIVAELESAREQQQKLTEQVASLQERLHVETSLQSDQSSPAASRPSNNNAVHELRVQLKQAQVDLEQSQHHNAMLKQSQRQLVEVNAQLQTQVDELQQAAHDQSARYAAVQQRQSELRRAYAQLQAEHQSATATMASQADVSASSAGGEDHDAAVREVGKLKAQLDRQAQDNDELQHSLALFKQLLDQERDANLGLRQDKALLSEHVKDLKLVGEANANRLDATSQERQHLAARVRELERALQFYQGVNNIRWSDLQTMAAQVQNLTQDMAAAS
eukprot:TRINITY_DN10731_c0_g1_i4.p1 TRINITY_DN10731_c0_g1~~TRINITY_DN10731_c0_g1_i4.p1  ORF type:complete len:533 (+),score=140.35 TRINITY_DN10731_c0_g1_i4:78-1601(+)